MVLIDSLVDRVTVERGLQSSAEEKGPGELAMKRVALFRRRGETMAEDDREETMYLGRGVLVTKVEGSVVFKRFSED